MENQPTQADTASEIPAVPPPASGSGYYRVVEDMHVSRLEKKVRNLMAAGFVPIGGVAVTTHSPNRSLFFQAMYFPNVEVTDAGKAKRKQ